MTAMSLLFLLITVVLSCDVNFDCHKCTESGCSFILTKRYAHVCVENIDSIKNIKAIFDDFYGCHIAEKLIGKNNGFPDSVPTAVGIGNTSIHTSTEMSPVTKRKPPIVPIYPFYGENVKPLFESSSVPPSTENLNGLTIPAIVISTAQTINAVSTPTTTPSSSRTLQPIISAAIPTTDPPTNGSTIITTTVPTIHVSQISVTDIPSTFTTENPTSTHTAASVLNVMPTAILNAKGITISTAQPVIIPTAIVTTTPSVKPVTIPTSILSAIPSAKPFIIPAAKTNTIPTAIPFTILTTKAFNFTSTNAVSIPSRTPTTKPVKTMPTKLGNNTSTHSYVSVTDKTLTLSNSVELFFRLPTKYECPNGIRNETLLVIYASSLCTIARLSEKYGTSNFADTDQGWFLLNPARKAYGMCTAIRHYRKKCRIHGQRKIRHSKIGLSRGNRSPLFQQVDSLWHCGDRTKEGLLNRLARTICYSGDVFLELRETTQLHNYDDAFGRMTPSFRHAFKCSSLYYRKRRCYI